LKATDLKFAISAAQEPNAKIAIEVPHQKIPSTSMDSNRERFNATSATKYPPTTRAKINKLGNTKDRRLSQPSKKFFFIKNPIIIQV
jgi:hypothetical protein